MWFLPDRATFKHMGSFLKLAVPGALILCCEWWIGEILLLFAGYIDVNSLVT